MTDNTQDFFLPADLVARALANLAEREHDAIDQLSRQSDQGEPTVKEELAFRLRDYNAFIKAGFEWGKGKRPVMTARGSWLVPSRTTGGVIYEVEKRDGYWHCGPNCKCQQFHWHTALVIGIEHAMEMADQEDDGDPEPSTPPDPDTLAIEQLAMGEPPAEYPEDEPPFPTEYTAHGQRLALARADRVAREFNADLFAA